MSTVSVLQARAQSKLENIRKAGRWRHRQSVEARRGAWVDCADGVSRRVFCSNDYLGLASDSRLLEAYRKASASGSTASQHVCGFGADQAALENELAAALGVEKVLVGGSGFAMNTGAIPVLAQSGDCIYSDALNHASLIDGCRLSRAKVLRYSHADATDLAARWELSSDGVGWVVTDALFSMDGDVAPLEQLASYAHSNGGAIYVDDAHGFGWAGQGRGHAYEAGIASTDMVQMVTFGKSLGTYGAALAGQRDVIEWLLQSARTTMFATALPPPVLAATRVALNITINEAEHREKLVQNIAAFRKAAAHEGLQLQPSTSPIQALILGGESRAMAWQKALWKAGFWVNAIRPPTVPEGTARLRITLSAGQSTRDIKALVEALAEILARESDSAMMA